MEQPELHALLARVREGDEDAVRELLQHFEPHVRRVVRRRLPTLLRSKFDSLDFVQSVWGDFFTRFNRGDIDFQTPGQLAKFLALVAQSKVTNESKRRATKKLDVTREINMGTDVQLVAQRQPDPTPSQTAVMNDQLETVLSHRPEVHRQIVHLRRQRFTFVEIAEKTGVDERTARRIIHDVEKELGINNAGK